MLVAGYLSGINVIQDIKTILAELVIAFVEYFKKRWMKGYMNDCFSLKNSQSSNGHYRQRGNRGKDGILQIE
jgi:hypothetical protein